MKYPTKHRYVAWDSDGRCWSYNQYPECIFSVEYGGGWGAQGRNSREQFLDDMCTGEWNHLVLDNENEEDMKILQAFRNL